MNAPRPDDHIRFTADAQARFDTAIAGLDDAAVRRPSRLPGWSVGHVLTHVARNADSHVRRAEGVVRNEVVEQYPGGRQGRQADIDAGAGRAAAALIDDVRASGAAVLAAWEAIPTDAWDRNTIDTLGRTRPMARLVRRRWQELEVHVVDLGTGVSHRDWSDAFVADWLPPLRDELVGRMGGAMPPPTPAGLDERDELAWLYGRLDGPRVPELPPWA